MGQGTKGSVIRAEAAEAVITSSCGSRQRLSGAGRAPFSGWDLTVHAVRGALAPGWFPYTWFRFLVGDERHFALDLNLKRRRKGCAAPIS